MYLSNGKSLNPIEDGVVCVWWSPLRGHMTSSVDSSESELAVVTGLHIATNLTIHEVLVPSVLNWPVFILNPGLGTVSTDDHIGISWILKDFVLVLQVSVHLNRPWRIWSVVYVALAKIPSLDSHWNIELSSNSGVIEVSENRFGINAGRNISKTLFQEGCVLSCSEEVLRFKVSEYRLRWWFWVSIASTKCIVRIDISHCQVELIDEGLADGRESVVEEGAIVSLPSEVGLRRQDSVPEAHIKHLICIVEIVVGAAVSHHEALKIGNKCATLILSAVTDIPIDSFDETRNIDSSIWLSRDIDISVLKFWELCHNGKKGHKIFICWIEISPNAFLFVTADWESNSSRAFNVNYVSFFIPWVRVWHKVILSIRKLIRTMLLKEAKHGWASRATIEPDYNWVCCLILLAESSYVMQTFLCAWNWGVSWVESPRNIGPLPQLIDFISSWICRDCSHSCQKSY